MWKRGLGVKSDYTTPDIFKFYTNTSKKPVVNLKQFTEVCRMFNLGLIEEIYRGFVFRIPANVGYLGIAKSISTLVFDDSGMLDTNKSKIPIDWGNTLKLWRDNPTLKHKKLVFHDNLHTNGIRYKIKWKKVLSTKGALKYYKFNAVRTFKRGLNKYIKSVNHVEYYEF